MTADRPLTAETLVVPVKRVCRREKRIRRPMVRPVN